MADGPANFRFLKSL